MGKKSAAGFTKITPGKTTILTAPLILNIESATEVCSICLAKGNEVVSLRESSERNDHAKVITSLIGECMEAGGYALHNLDAVAVSTGPGSYTSLRVGVSTAKGICYALGKPLIAVSTLRALAETSGSEAMDKAAYHCPMIDARRMEVYCEIFGPEGLSIQGPMAKIIDSESFSNFFSAGRTIFFSGNGAEKCRAVLSSPFARFSSNQICSSVDMTSLSTRSFFEGTFVDAAYFTPLYLKSPNITAAKKNNDIIN